MNLNYYVILVLWLLAIHVSYLQFCLSYDGSSETEFIIDEKKRTQYFHDLFSDVKMCHELTSFVPAHQAICPSDLLISSVNVCVHEN